MEEPSTDRNYGRIMWVYGFAVLMMLVMVQFLSNLLPGFFLIREAKSDPQLQETIKTINAERSVAWDLDETELAKQTEELAPFYARLNWFVIGLISSLLVYSTIGYFVGYFSGEPAGAGFLPFLGVLMMRNPAVVSNFMEYHGVNGIGLSFGQQAILLVIQMVVVYAAAELGDRKRRAEELASLS